MNLATTAAVTIAVTLAVILTVPGCTQVRSPSVGADDLPAQWHSSAHAQAINENWLRAFGREDLITNVDRVLDRNYALAQQAIAVKIAYEDVRGAFGRRLPALGLSLGAQRGRAVGDAPITNQVDVRATFDLDLDIWGRLSDMQRQAQMRYAAEQMRYLDLQRSLVGNTASAMFTAISAQQLHDLFSQRLSNLTQSLDVIEQGYRSGLNPALDVYLAQTTVEQERANVANQQQAVFTAKTNLELLSADYPDATFQIDAQLPELAPLHDIGIPAQLLERRADVQIAWFNLLATDAALAVAHKNRMPGLSFSANVRDSANAISRLLDGGELAFTAAASLLAPLFQGGRLRSLERQAKLSVEQAEQRYLQVVYAAMAEVENELSNAASLATRYEAFVAAQSNAESALKLAFDQYQKGLVTYTTVLESQRRAFDAQTTALQLRNLRLQSRVALLLALGGNY